MITSGIAAIVITLGGGTALYYNKDVTPDIAAIRLDEPYIQKIANDKEASDAVKVAMVMGFHYESSNRVITKPYDDKYGARGLGRKHLWTVCMGITDMVLPKGQKIDPNKTYTVDECYNMEKRIYIKTEQQAKQQLIFWNKYGPYQKAVFIDFIHNKGIGAFINSTMKRKANMGDLNDACEENPRWRFAGPVVLPGLEIRGNANEEICSTW